MRPLRALAAVLAAFFGVRRSRAANVDRQLRFADLIAAAIILVALFVGGLLLLVSWLTAP
ncbi:DUF2970 domain-containing protein [Vogesella indigofera]|uniref:DUF2970 domain-containing protein n=1 Tax=Vogesella indigofera TaxID=45465 RepID=UPI00234CD2F1|nr:DUF2970 domain-containing protein [Vogesella indigofera]MDC7705349.1 DUF2970 domain-containing protein [Vogesella indigofera]